jgi:acetolactate synthase-1/2/3 large subunit
MTSDTPVREEHRGVLTELDQVGLFRPITKWSERVNRASGMEDAVHRAVRIATSDRPGAVHLSLPSDVLEDEEGVNVRAGQAPTSSMVPSSRPRADRGEVQRAADLISQAERAVIVAGGGVLTSGAWDQLTAFAEATGIPVGTSINGKGAIAETSACAIGVVGNNGARSYANAWIAEADLILFIGTRTDSTTTVGWTLPPKSSPPVTIHLDVSSREIGNNYPSSAFLQGDAAVTLEDLLAAIDHPETLRQRNAVRLVRLTDERDAYFTQVDQIAGSDSRPIKPQRLIAELRALLDDEAVIVADPGTPTPYLSAQYVLNQPGRTTVIPRAYGALGYAIPGVVGAHYAAPGRRVVGMLGDGSYGMSVGELETISRLDLPVVIIQCDNGSYGWIKELQHLYHDRRYFSVDFNRIDYATIAKGFGLRGYHVEDPAALGGVLREAFSDGRPAFVNVVTEAQMTETPPVATWERTAAAQAAQ